MTDITYIKGDATRPEAGGTKIICHVCNDIGAWGAGFVVAISRRWREPEAEYRAWHAAGAEAGFSLGAVRFVQVEADLWVANMVAQRGIRNDHDIPPIRYDAVGECLEQVAAKARELDASVHMPRIGCGLAGGEWSKMEPIILEWLDGIAVTVYDFG